MTPADHPPLRVAFLVDSLVQRQWVYRVVEDVARSSIAIPVLVITNDAPRPRDWPTRARAAFAKRSRLLRKLYVEVDKRLFRDEPDPFAPRDLRPLLDGCAIVPVKPIQTRYCDYFPDDVLPAILAHRVDVAFRFGFRILLGEALHIARYGVWSYHHGDNMAVRGGPAGFWEVMLGHHVTGSILQVLTSELDAGRVLYRSWASTYKYSLARSRHNYYWKSASFALRKLKDLHERGPVALEEDASASLYRPYTYPLYRTPGNAEMLRLLSKLALRIARRAARSAFRVGQWALAIKIGKVEGPAQSLHGFRLLIPPRDRFWADPFPVARDGRYFIFVEEFVYRAGKGRIAVIEVDEKGSRKEPVTVLEASHHLSYPFVFEWQGTLHMIPETRAKKTVELYRCVGFPAEWKLEKVLLDGISAVDATLAEIDGRWWMFTNVNVEGASANDELHLFHAKSPLGPWTPHRRNPVKSDVRSSRPAGRLFVHKGQLYRPSQDSSVAYGFAICINKVVRVDPDEFVEEEVSKILPRWRRGVERNHTLNSAGRLTVVDAYRYRRRFP